MRARRFGRTGIQISEVVFGGGWVGGILIHPDDATKRQAIRIALDAGINWIDTAESYGDGQSETAIGWLLGEVEAARRPQISTKFRLDVDSSESHASQIERKLNASLERLQMDRVALYQLHNPITAESSGGTIAAAALLRDGGVFDSLDRLREQGLFGHIGITALGENAAIQQVVASGRINTAQVYYNLIHPSAGLAPDHGAVPGADFRGLIACCREHDVGIMNIRIFAAGVIATDVRHGREVPVTAGADLDAETRQAHRILELLGDSYGTRAQTALRFGLANPHVSCVVLGLAELAHLHEALAGAAMGPLPFEAMRAVNGLYEAGMTG